MLATKAQRRTFGRHGRPQFCCFVWLESLHRKRRLVERCPLFSDIVMVAFITINVGKCGAGSVRRRSWLGMAGVAIIVCAGVAAYGLNSGFSKSNVYLETHTPLPTLSWSRSI